MDNLSRVALAIDPGSSKCGLAVVSQTHAGEMEILHRAVVANEELVAAISELRATHAPDLVVIGSGTGGRNLLRHRGPQPPAPASRRVAEPQHPRGGRAEHHPDGEGALLAAPWAARLAHLVAEQHASATGSMQVPPEPVDDFAAVILAERALQRH